MSNIWTTLSRYVDVETGEELTKHQAVKYYQIIKKHKHVKVDNRSGKRWVEILNECRKNKYRQQEITYV